MAFAGKKRPKFALTLDPALSKKPKSSVQFTSLDVKHFGTTALYPRSRPIHFASEALLHVGSSFNSLTRKLSVSSEAISFGGKSINS